MITALKSANAKSLAGHNAKLAAFKAAHDKATRA